MILLKCIAKILLFPMMLLLKLIELVGIFLITPLSVLLNLLSWGMLIIAVLSYLMGLEDGIETVRMIQSAFIVFVLPRIGEFMVGLIVIIRMKISLFIIS